MPLVSLGAHYAVMAGIEDVTRPIVVDTGAATTLLKASVAKELGLKEDPQHAQRSLGIGQTTGDSHLNVIPSRLAFGALALRDRSTGVATMDDGQTPEKESIGLLGDDILSQFDVEFDFPAHTLTFYREVGCYATFLPWTGVFSTIPFDHHGAKVTIDVMLNSERTRAMIDTGNNLSFVSLGASALWGAATADLAPTGIHAKSPLNGTEAMAVSAYSFKQVKIGDKLFNDKKLSVIDANLPLASANLGLDYWSSRKMWISYLHQWLFVADDPSAVKLAYPIETVPAVAVGATPTQIAGPN
jgi:predicted aspartyl protease